MKKLLLLLIILLLGGGGAYYYFFMMTVPVAEEPLDTPEEAPITEGGITLDSISEMATSLEPGEYYVTASSLNVRREPSAKGRISKVLDIGSKVTVIESQDGWSRISEYVEYGDGEFAQWVSEEFLSAELPDNLATVRSGRLEIQIKHSDDFAIYRGLFLSISQKLIDDGTCTNKDFQETKGWLRSTVYDDRPVYYTYCGGLERHHKIYLDVQSRRSFTPNN